MTVTQTPSTKAELVAAVLSGDLSEMATPYSEEYANFPPFEALSIRFLDGFKDNFEQANPHTKWPYSQWETIRHGFNVVARGILIGKLAYQQYCEEAGITGTSDELQEALLHPATVDTFVSLANTDNSRALHYEAQYGLRMIPGQTNIVADAFTYDETLPAIYAKDLPPYKSDVERYDMEKPLKAGRICGAAKFISKIWNAMVIQAEKDGLLDPESEDAI